MAQCSYLLVYTVAALLQVLSCNAQFCDRVTLSDLGGIGAPTSNGLLSDSLVRGDSGPGIFPSVEVFHLNIVCETIGLTRGTYRYTSVVVNYTVDSNPATTSQFDYECNIAEGAWSGIVFFSRIGTVTTSPNSSFDTPLASNCGACVSPLRGELVFEGNITVDENHCAPCSGCIGLNQCTSAITSACCNYYTNDFCTTICPTDSTLNTTINECICTPGLTGGSCTLDINECTADPELCTVNGGTCINSFGSYMCQCTSGFKGMLCENDIDECVEGTDDCMNGATCVNTNGSYQCICPPTFTGTLCETDVNECLLQNPCENGGTCENTNGSFNCTCQPGYTGVLCENDIDECTTSPCHNNGMCVNLPGTFMCNCISGFTGNICDLDINECVLVSPCGIGGRCNNTDGSFICTCNPGFSGQTCNNIDECSQGSNPCDNDGTCIDSDGSFSCMCTPTFTGPACENDIDECAIVPGICLNGGTCHNVRGSFLCICPSGYSGMNCDKDIDECQTLDRGCQNGGTCVNNDGGFNCTCRPGFSGLICDVDIDECLQDPCQNGGTCNNTLGSYNCHCGRLWNGQICDECLITFCSVCSGIPAQCRECNDGYDRTESGSCIFTEVCSPVCKQGTCINRRCECTIGFSGEDCSVSCSARIPGCALCSMSTNAQEVTCDQCEIGYNKVGNECKASCLIPFCDECDISGDQCLKCATTHRLNLATKECLLVDDNNGLSILQIIGLIVGMILLAITIIAITACIVFGIFRAREIPKIKRNPKHSQKSKHLYVDSKKTIELEKAETGLTDAQMVTLEYMTPDHDLYDGPEEGADEALKSISEEALDYEPDIEDDYEDSI